MGAAIFWAFEHLIALGQGDFLPSDLPSSIAGYLSYVVLGAVLGGLSLLGGFASKRLLCPRWTPTESSADAFFATASLVGVIGSGLYWVDKVLMESYWGPTYLDQRWWVLALLALMLLGVSLIIFVRFKRIREGREALFLASVLGLSLLVLGGRAMNESGAIGHLLSVKNFIFNGLALPITGGIIWAGYGVLKRSGGKAQVGLVLLLLVAPLGWLGVLASFSAVSSAVHPALLSPRRPNILLIVMDTTRRDHLSVYGYHRRTVPFLEGLAERGVTFLRAYSTSPVTPDGHGAIFTGQYPARHGLRYPYHLLSRRHITLASLLKTLGYRTAGFSNNPWVKAGTGAERGFERFELVQHLDWVFVRSPFFYEEVKTVLGVGRPRNDKGAALTHRRVERWLRKTSRDPSPLLLFINYMEPHDPYTYPDQVRNLFSSDGETGATFEKVLGYDRNLAYLDGMIQKLLALPQIKERLNDMLIIVTSDHGEMFGEHGLWLHDNGLYEPVLAVPLILVYPRVLPEGLRVEGPVQVTDIFPTILDVLGLSSLGQSLDLQGQSLIPLLKGSPPNPRTLIFEHYTRAVSRGLLEGKWKYIATPDGGKEFLFDLSRDRGEEHNQITDFPDVAERMRSHLKSWVDSNFTPSDTEDKGLDPATRERLRALGYVVD
jgi:arylsulfatase A-like enzyme